MTEELKPCPFCGSGETRMDKNQHWTGMHNVVISVTLRHFCSIGGTQMTFTRKTEELCSDAWNTRAEMEKSDD